MRIKYPSNLSPQEREKWDYNQQYLSEIAKRYTVKHTYNPILRNFYLFNSKKKTRYFNSWRVSNGQHSLILCLIEYEIQWEEAGYLRLRKSFGQTLIRKETVLDKIEELLNPMELDFPDHKAFSQKYYVLTDDEDLLKSSLDEKLKDYLVERKNLSVEFHNRACVFRHATAADIVESIRLCEIGFKLDELINH